MSDLYALEQQLANAKELIEMRDLLLRLSENRDFRKAIREQWMVIEAARFVGVSGDPTLTDREKEDAYRMAQAPGHLKRWMSMTIRQGNTAESDKFEIEQALEELRAQDMAEQNVSGGLVE